MFTIMKKSLIVILLIMVGCLSAAAQKQKITVTAEIEVVDESGNTMPFAVIKSAKKRNIYTTDDKGHIILQVLSDDILKISSEGYAEQIVPAESGKLSVILKKDVPFNGEANKLYTLYGETTERRTVGAWSKVDGRELEMTPTLSFFNAIGGRLNGLFTYDNTPIDNAEITNFNNSWSRANQGQILIFVDGVEREGLDYIDFETIESVQLVKDASLKALYGGINCSGILMIKTRRGKPYENSARVNIETGIQQPLRLPEYLNSYDYAMMFNKARENDGLPIQYSGEELEKYRMGTDPILYPDIDFYKMFLNSQMNITRANMQYSGGNENTQFFAHLGYKSNGGLEKYTDSPNNDRVFTIRGNVDNKILEIFTFQAGFNAALQNKTWYNNSAGSFMNMLSDTRPNEYPIFIPGGNVGEPEEEFVLGGTATNRTNPYGELVRDGSIDREYSYVQSDFALNIDMNRWVTGLSLRPMVSFDTYSFINTTLNGTYKIWAPHATGDPVVPIEYDPFGEDFRAVSQTAGTATTMRNYAFSVTGTYNHSIDKHDIHALAIFYGQRKESSSGSEDFRWSQDLKRLNMGGTVNYMYNKRYIAEASVNRTGVSSFAPGKRFGVFPTFGLGWVMSDESFLQGVEWLDYLKLRASYGIQGSTDYNAEGLFTPYLYQTLWESSGNYTSMGGENLRRAQQIQAGNPDIGFQKNHELNVGIDFLLFRTLKVSAGYFNTRLDGAMATIADAIPGVSGKGGTLMMQNYKQFKTYGWEGEATYNNRVGNLNYSLSFNIAYGKAKVTKEADPDYPENLKGLRKVTNLGDVRGLHYIGTFQSESEIAESPLQLNGEPVGVGDLKYTDTNNDGYVDDADRVIIGNTIPSVQYGITLKISWKGFNLDLLGYGLSGFDQQLNNKYYQIYGNRKYSRVLIDGLPNGNPHPIITTLARSNNYVSSDYWMVDGSWFKLRNAELGYTLPYMLTEKVGIGGLKVFFRGFNLMTVSKIKDRDPESLAAGINMFPLCRTFAGGISVSF